MIKSLKIFSIVIVVFCFGIVVYLRLHDCYEISVQNSIIDREFSINNTDLNDYLAYIYIPRFNIRKIIKEGTSSDVLDAGYVGIYDFSYDLSGSDLIILAGHNIFSVFSRLHSISIGDLVYIRNNSIDRKFIVYDKKIVGDTDFSQFYNRKNELLLITCTNKKGYRLFVFLKEEL